MNADQYLLWILRREAVDSGPALAVLVTLRPLFVQWANQYLAGFAASRSFAKGTANKSGTDIDIFISLKSNTRETLREIYNGLFSFMQSNGYAPKRQDVSINIRVGAIDVDLVPGVLQDAQGQDHSIYRRHADTWTKTNVVKRISAEFGFTPASRSRISTPRPEEPSLFD